MSTPLAFVISAKSGTRAADVLQAMASLPREKNPHGVSFKLNVEEGVVLREVSGVTYSPKYIPGGTVESPVCIMTVGRDLPEGRVLNAAENLIAVISRGEPWTDGNVTYTHAYGNPPNAMAQKRRNERRRIRWRMNRSGGAHRSYGCVPMYSWG